MSMQTKLIATGSLPSGWCSLVTPSFGLLVHPDGGFHNLLCQSIAGAGRSPHTSRCSGWLRWSHMPWYPSGLLWRRCAWSPRRRDFQHPVLLQGFRVLGHQVLPKLCAVPRPACRSLALEDELAVTCVAGTAVAAPAERGSRPRRGSPLSCFWFSVLLLLVSLWFGPSFGSLVFFTTFSFLLSPSSVQSMMFQNASSDPFFPVHLASF